jgi:hypothetical protein
MGLMLVPLKVRTKVVGRVGGIKVVIARGIGGITTIGMVVRGIVSIGVMRRM